MASPHDQGRRRVLAQPRLPSRIGSDVRPVVVQHQIPGRKELALLSRPGQREIQAALVVALRMRTIAQMAVVWRPRAM